ncbi:hypothetical protein [Microbacterium hominis]|uniref:Uncharacterized protein n=1 Tax=Microbacterium hominis TaxID=162426 RepID=A0A7D4UIT7_9MICO|nr:hypothetical protein [Microbacterium hominis]QKJ20248.1 hypothetical protein HQM25_13360 [Microbacterium hominis]
MPVYWSSTWSVLGVLGTLAAIVVAVVIYRRQFPRQRVDHALEITPVLTRASDSLKDAVRISFRDHQLADPYLLRLELHSRSRADIASAQFDGARPLRFELGRSAIPLSQADDDSPIAVELVDSALEVKPDLIRKGARANVIVLTDGKPEMTVDNPLINIDVSRAAGGRPSHVAARAFWWTLGIVASHPSA